MSTDQDAAARRIMDQFGEESRIPYLNIEEGDVGVLIAFPIVGLFIAGLTGIESLALPFVAGVRVRRRDRLRLARPPQRVDVDERRLSLRQAPPDHVQFPRGGQQ